MTKPQRRSDWRTVGGKWTKSLGDRGTRVRLFQNRRGGTFYRAVWRPGEGRTVASLHTNDRDEADRLGRALYAALIAGMAQSARPVVRLGELAERFVAESPTFLDNASRTQAEARSRIAILQAVIGEARDVRTLTENDVRQYEARRRAGGIRYGDGAVTGAAKQRSVQADIKLLKQMLYWACSRTTMGGHPWLDRNPLQYVRVAGEHDVRRPVASHERFEATRASMRQLQARYGEESRQAKSARECARAGRRQISWLRAELGFVLLEATGRRRGAIMGLRWSDVDYAAGTVTWRAEHDKKRKTWVVPYPASLFETVRDLQRRIGAVGGYLFPRGDDQEQPAPAELLSQWIRRAEDHAGLPKLVGGTCHRYRRKWRSERSHHPLKAVAVAGGWSDVQTMLRCYDQPDEADVLEVTSELRKRRERSLNPAAALGG
jgi:integrase